MRSDDLTVVDATACRRRIVRVRRGAGRVSFFEDTASALGFCGADGFLRRNDHRDLLCHLAPRLWVGALGQDSGRRPDADRPGFGHWTAAVREKRGANGFLYAGPASARARSRLVRHCRVARAVAFDSGASRSAASTGAIKGSQSKLRLPVAPAKDVTIYSEAKHNDPKYAHDFFSGRDLRMDASAGRAMGRNDHLRRPERSIHNPF